MKLWKSPKTLILGGIFFLFPLLLVFFLVGHAVKELMPAGRRVVEFLGIHSLFGAATVTIMVLLVMLLVCYVSGLLLRKGLLRDWSNGVEDLLILLFPNWQMLKYKLTGEKRGGGRERHWKAILLEDTPGFHIAFIVRTDGDFLTLFIPDAPGIGSGELRYIKKSACKFQRISMQEAMTALGSFGRNGDLTKYLDDT